LNDEGGHLSDSTLELKNRCHLFRSGEIKMLRPRLVQILSSAAIVVIIVLLFVGVSYYISMCVYYHSAATEASARGRIVPKQEWPHTFVDLLKDAEQHHIEMSNIRVYQMSNDEYYWKSDSSPELFELMSNRWDLRAAREDHKLVGRFQERMPTSLVASSHPDGISYYLSSNWLAGEKGDLHCVMTDKTNRVVIVRYYYNF
jgi:hypothetical protein